MYQPPLKSVFRPFTPLTRPVSYSIADGPGSGSNQSRVTATGDYASFIPAKMGLRKMFEMINRGRKVLRSITATRGA